MLFRTLDAKSLSLTHTRTSARAEKEREECCVIFRTLPSPPQCHLPEAQVEETTGTTWRKKLFQPPSSPSQRRSLPRELLLVVSGDTFLTKSLRVFCSSSSSAFPRLKLHPLGLPSFFGHSRAIGSSRLLLLQLLHRRGCRRWWRWREVCVYVGVWGRETEGEREKDYNGQILWWANRITRATPIN